MLEVISSKEFDRYARKSEVGSFYQTSSWGILKEKNGWKKHFLALKDNDVIKAATLILEKKTKIGSIFYAPRGFLLDYQNKELLQEMTLEVKRYVKKHKGIMFKIDPYLEYVERDINGDIVANGENNEHVIKELEELGYKRLQVEHEAGGLQPNWLFVLPLKGKTEEDILKDMNSNAKRNLSKIKMIDFEILELEKKELVRYEKIMEHTASRRGFIDRSLAYYQDMYNALGDDIKIFIAVLHVDKYLARLEENLKQITNEKDVLLKKEVKDEEKRKAQVAEKEKEEVSLHKKIEEANTLKEKYGESIDMAGAMFITYGVETVYLFSGSYDEFMDFNAQYALQWHIIRYAIKNGYQRHNFYGISNKFDKDDSMYGIYMFKRGFGGHVVELIGEFDYVINKPKYLLYQLALKGYRFTKR